jgi:hypothetical protein
MPAFEKLHGVLVFFRCLATGESPQVPPPAGARVDLSRIKPVLARLQLADHCFATGCSLALTYHLPAPATVRLQVDVVLDILYALLVLGDVSGSLLLILVVHKTAQLNHAAVNLYFDVIHLVGGIVMDGPGDTHGQSLVINVLSRTATVAVTRTPR